MRRVGISFSFETWYNSLLNVSAPRLWKGYIFKGENEPEQWESSEAETAKAIQEMGLLCHILGTHMCVVCLYGHVCWCGLTCIYMYEDHGLTSGVSLYHTLPYCALEVIEPGFLFQLDWLASKALTWAYSISCCWRCRCILPHLDFLWVLRIQNQLLLLTHQAIYQLLMNFWPSLHYVDFVNSVCLLHTVLHVTLFISSLISTLPISQWAWVLVLQWGTGNLRHGEVSLYLGQRL